LIVKANQRGGGAQLAAHLMNEFDNDYVEQVELRGAAAPDIAGAVKEWEAQSRATKIKKKFMYHMSISPDQERNGHLTREQYLDFIERTERSLKLIKQPRAIFMHVKKDERGVPREHCHVVWSRTQITPDRIRAVDIAHDRLKLRAVIRDFARDHGLEIPEGTRKKARRTRLPHEVENHAERRQRERSGIPKARRVADITTAWKETGNGAAFVQALEKKGYFIAQGGRVAFVVVDLHGEVHSLPRQIEGVRTKQVRERLADIPAGKIPGLAQAQQSARKALEEYDKRMTGERAGTELARRVEDHRKRQAARRDKLDRERVDMLARHIGDRDGLKALQEADISAVAAARLAKKPKGLIAFLSRITGVRALQDARARRDDIKRTALQQQEKDALKRRHDRELKGMDRRFVALERLEAYENKSIDAHVRRDRYHGPERRAPDREPGPTRDGEDQFITPTADFNRTARPSIDLTEEFNRHVDRRLQKEKDSGREPDGPGRDPRGN
jgi:hypothetical protein